MKRSAASSKPSTTGAQTISAVGSTLDEGADEFAIVLLLGSKKMEKGDAVSAPGVLSRFDEAQNPGRVSRHDRVTGNIFGDYAASAHDGVLANAGVGENGCAGADRCALLDDRLLDLPIGFGLQASSVRGGPGIAIVDEDYPVSDKDVVLNDDAFADKGVAGYLAALADKGIFLNFDECADFCIASNLATVQIDEFCEPDVFTQLDVA